jgi:BirA family biotin operon repressor/biotin-[acetyl-CoA-carboxylase] ligase
MTDTTTGWSWRNAVHRHGSWSRVEWLSEVESTNDTVMGWLQTHGYPMSLAVADVQTAGRGRRGRQWLAPRDSSLLCSVGFSSSWLQAGDEWKLAAIVSLAMAEAAEEVAPLPANVVRMKWPNDLVAVDEAGTVRKLAGVLGETESAGTSESKTVIGIGVNANWARVAFPADLADSMTSLSEITGRPVDRERLLSAFMLRVETLEDALQSRGDFPEYEWRRRQLTNNVLVRLDWPDGSAETVRAVDVNADTGALVITPPDAPLPRRHIIVGEIHHLRVAGAVQP